VKTESGRAFGLTLNRPLQGLPREANDDMDGIGMTGAREWIPRSSAQRVAQRLRDRRRAMGLTQVELAAEIGVAPPTYVHWETGRVPDTIATITVKALAAALQIPEGWLLSPDAPSLPDPVVMSVGVPACRAFRNTGWTWFRRLRGF
jgi:DNA-binding XRE family transcriptional regulator